MMSQDSPSFGVDSGSSRSARPTRFTQSNASFQALFFSVLKRPWILIVTVLLVMIPASIYLLNDTRLYESSATLMVPVQENRMSINNLISDGNQNAKPEHYYTSILSSEDFEDELVAELRVRYPELADMPRKGIVRAFSFERDTRKPGLFTLHSVSPNEDLVNPLITVAIEEFQNRISQFDQQEARSVVDFIDAQLGDLNSKLIEAEDELQSFLRENQFIIDNPELGIAQELTSLEKQYADAKAELNLVQLDIESMEKQIQEIMRQVGGDQDTLVTDQIRDLRAELESIKQQEDQARARGASQGVLDSLGQRRNTITTQLLQASLGQFSGQNLGRDLSLTKLEEMLGQLVLQQDQLRNRVRFFETRIDMFRSDHPEISQDILTYTGLVRKRDVLKQTLEILLEKREEARIRMAAQLGGVKVLEDPTEVEPLARHTVIKIIVVFIISLLLGLVASYIVDLSLMKVDVERDITDNFDTSVLGVLPPVTEKDLSRKVKSSNSLDEPGEKLITNLSTRSWFIESLRGTKTSLLFRASESNARSIVMTSPMPSEGKTLTCANLAISITDSGKKVLIIDCDLRRPTLHRIFRTTRKPGITEHMLDPESYPLETVVRKTHVDGLDFIPAGKSQRNPAELLGSNTMKDLIAHLKTKYDFVMIDSPPVLPAVDSRLLGSLADGLVLLARAEKTKMRNLEIAFNQISSLDINLLGMVLNQSSRRYGGLYYYVYGYYHSYYYYKPYSGYYAATEEAIKQDEEEEQERLAEAGQQDNDRKA